MTFLEGALAGSTLVITTNVSQPVTVDLGAAATPGPPNPVLALLQPKVEVYNGGALVTSWMPYGEPTPIDWWQWLLIFLLAGLALTLFRMRRA